MICLLGFTLLEICALRYLKILCLFSYLANMFIYVAPFTQNRYSGIATHCALRNAHTVANCDCYCVGCCYWHCCVGCCLGDCCCCCCIDNCCFYWFCDCCWLGNCCCSLCCSILWTSIGGGNGGTSKLTSNMSFSYTRFALVVIFFLLRLLALSWSGTAFSACVAVSDDDLCLLCGIDWCVWVINDALLFPVL